MPRGIFERTPEFRAKMSAALKGRKKPPRTNEHRIRQSMAHRGKPQNHPERQTDNPAYTTVHHQMLPFKTGNCSECGESRYTEMALINGRETHIDSKHRKYSIRGMIDYLEMCCPCHRKYDRHNETDKE